MSLSIPLGVRIYQPGLFDVWVTKYVDDISFRSVIPGGFASATITLHRPSPITITSSATATGAGTSSTFDYLVASDADATDINIGDRVHIYDSAGAIRFNGQPFTITSKPSAFGFTNLTFTPSASAATVSGDVMRCSNATGYLSSDPGLFNQIAQLYNRVQIVDLRSGEIAWEGRIEDPGRNSDDDTWELGCLGAMVVASDIQRPVFYIDNDVDSWIPNTEYLQDIFSMTEDNTSRTLSAKCENTSHPAGIQFVIYRWQQAEAIEQYIGRFDITYSGIGPSTMETQTWVADGGYFNVQQDVDVTALNAADTRKGNAIGAVNSFTSQFAQELELLIGAASLTTISDSNKASTQWIRPHVQALRVDRNGTKLTTSASYPADYVTVPQVVEDVVGRFLVSAWPVFGAQSLPYQGHVRAEDVYIDATSTAEITGLTFYDGTTAAGVLNELMLAQPDAYWAIWESNFGATDGADGRPVTGHRFEWATWPAGWGYQASSVDGLQEQPNGENLYNVLFYKWGTEDSSSLVRGFQYLKFDQEEFNNRYLTAAQLTRAITVKREELTDNTTATTAAASTIRSLGKTTNSGSLTVRRPIQFYDAGVDSLSGASRMVDPWLIRPGKLIRITDLPAAARSGDFAHGNTAPAAELDGTVFKVVATEYSSADNSCKLELDQVASWATPTQIQQATEGPQSTVRAVG